MTRCHLGSSCTTVCPEPLQRIGRGERQQQPVRATLTLAAGAGTLALVLGPLARASSRSADFGGGSDQLGLQLVTQSSEGPPQRFAGSIGDVAAEIGGALDRDSLKRAATEEYQTAVQNAQVKPRPP